MLLKLINHNIAYHKSQLERISTMIGQINVTSQFHFSFIFQKMYFFSKCFESGKGKWSIAMFSKIERTKREYHILM